MYGRAAAVALLVSVSACSSSSSSKGSPPGTTAVTTTTITTTTTAATTTSVGSTLPVELRWELAADFRRRPDHNPFSHTVGGPPVWSLRHRVGLDRSGVYPRLPEYTRVFARGAAAWHGATGACGGLPAIGVTASRPAEVCNTMVPENSVFLSPARDQLAVVGWESPITGEVLVAAGFGDLDPECGGSVPYWIDLVTAPLASGEVVRDGSKSLPAVRTPVTQGQSIYFIVGPSGAGRPGCDATQMHVTIAPASAS